ncbi:hypothetical protein OUZ56_031491 [Daphnia magna]|uniref:Uncharacterized protein n=1 Tax=Daphnia magna TaxID=35525 RepID=A0ABQ9ZUE1_9CRUS|nr:hypothetical protein OUZ56_031491 [Daphnia magna]
MNNWICRRFIFGQFDDGPGTNTHQNVLFVRNVGRQMKRPFVLVANKEFACAATKRYTAGIRILSEIKPEVILALKQTPRRIDKNRC